MKRRFVISFLLLLLALALARAAGAQGPEPLAGWEVIAEDVRVTYYGPRYTGGEITASGVRYMKDNDTAALGPYLLWLVRDHYYDQAQALGSPMAWGWKPGLELWQSGNVAGCYHVPVTLERARLWGCGIRVCAETATGGWLCRELRTADTGAAELEVDLPDSTWLWWGYPASRGVFTGTVEVLSW